MDTRQWLRRLASTVALGLIVCGAAPSQNTFESEESLFVQNLHPPGVHKGLSLSWIPKPLEKYCLGKTIEQCSTIDYCIRTTNRKIKICENLGLDLAKVAVYPPSLHPRRVLSVVLIGAPPITSIDVLLQFYDSKPNATFDRLSQSVRVKARVKLTRLADDDRLEILEVLAVPPL